MDFWCNCGKFGKSYYWCYTVKNWDYCTPTTYVTFKDTNNEANNQVTRTVHSWKIDNEECSDECTKHNGLNYNWCHTVNHGENVLEKMVLIHMIDMFVWL